MLQKYQDHHKGCHRTSCAPPLLRLIDVWNRRNDSVQVVDTESIENPRWAALSYCWGKSEQSGRTTDANMKERRSQLALYELPLTIRDAIHVCRQLNIQYLWVDSICIVQDDPTDKLTEIAKMIGIYQNPIITVSASCASSTDRGFLEFRRPYPPRVALPVRTGKGYAVAHLIEVAYNLRPDPVATRAWTFQERFLSARFLSFARSAVEWKCSELGCNLDKHGRYSKPRLLDSSRNIYRSDCWNALVIGYSSRRLSYLKDKPVAFAGVAQAYCQANSLKPDDYLAGLWRQTLLKDLLWFLNFDSYVLHGFCAYDQPVGNSAEDPYIAPSWSWVSALYPVCWFLKDLVETAKVISTQIELVQPDLRFGALKSGSLRLRGRLHHDKHSINWCGNVTREYKHQSHSHYYERETITADLNDLRGKHVWFFEIGVLQDIGTDEHRLLCEEDPFHEKDPFREEIPCQHTNLSGDLAGLILLSTGKEKEFTRVGVYKEDLKGTSYDYFFNETFDDSCHWCALNKHRELTEVEII